jgi:hypothetical protein
VNPVVTDYIFNVPENTEFDLLPAQTQAVISQLSPEWPDFPMLNTHAVEGRKLLMVRMKARLSKAQLEQLFTAHLLDWQVIWIRSAYLIGDDYLTIFPVDKSLILPFVNEIVESIDEQGNVTTRPATMNDTIYLSAYAGTDPLEV